MKNAQALLIRTGQPSPGKQTGKRMNRSPRETWKQSTFARASDPQEKPLNTPSPAVSSYPNKIAISDSSSPPLSNLGEG